MSPSGKHQALALMASFPHRAQVPEPSSICPSQTEQEPKQVPLSMLPMAP